MLTASHAKVRNNHLLRLMHVSTNNVEVILVIVPQIGEEKLALLLRFNFQVVLRLD